MFADQFFEIPVFLSENIIAHIYWAVLLLILLRLLSKNKTDISTPLNIIKWIIISYCSIAVLGWLFVLIFPTKEKYAIVERSTGQYAWAYWLMLFFNCLFPFILLIKRIGKNAYLVFLISVLMNFGLLLERFVIIITSIHRDYL